MRYQSLSSTRLCVEITKTAIHITYTYCAICNLIGFFFDMFVMRSPSPGGHIKKERKSMKRYTIITIKR